MEGDPLVDRLMKPVIATIEHYVKNQAGVIAIYNRAYEAVMNSMVVLDTMRDQLSKANAHAEEAEKFAALKQERCAELELRLDAYNGNMIDTLQARAEAAEARVAELEEALQKSNGALNIAAGIFTGIVQSVSDKALKGGE